MANSHGLADVASELQATCQDLLAPCVIGGNIPAVPGSGMVLAAFATQGYVMDGEQLVYVDQPAVSVALTGSPGNYLLAIHRDTSSAVAGWTRRVGSHYLWQTNVTLPANPAGALVFAQVTVVGTNITAVAAVPGACNPMSKQMSSAVAITGGNITGSTAWGTTGQMQAQDRSGDNQIAFQSLLNTAGGTNRWALLHQGTAPSSLMGQVRLGGLTSLSGKLDITWQRPGEYGLVLKTTGDTGSEPTVYFLNASGGGVGSITQTATATSYNTSSDVRFKHAIAALAGALVVVQALRPVTFRWNANDEPGEGFLAHELMRHVPAAVTGEPDAVDAQGNIVPQGVDHSRLVPWLTACCQELAAQVQALTARVASLENNAAP